MYRGYSQQGVSRTQQENASASKLMGLKKNQGAFYPLESPQKAEAMRTASSDFNIYQDTERLGDGALHYADARASGRGAPSDVDMLLTDKRSNDSSAVTTTDVQAFDGSTPGDNAQLLQGLSAGGVNVVPAENNTTDEVPQHLSVEHPEYPPYLPDDEGSNISHENPSARPKVSRMSEQQILAMFSGKPEISKDGGRFIGDVVDGMHKGAWLDEGGKLLKVGRYDEVNKTFSGTQFREKDEVIFGQTVNGRQSGKAQTYDKNGYLSIDGIYKRGVLNGDVEVWSGDLVYFGEAVDGWRDGDFILSYHGERYEMSFDKGEVKSFGDSGTSGLLRTQATMNLNIVGHPGGPPGLGVVMFADVLNNHVEEFGDNPVFNALRTMLAQDTKDLGRIGERDIQQAAAKSATKPVLLIGGTPNHQVGYVLHKNKLYVANRGEGAYFKTVDPKTKDYVPYHEPKAVHDQAIDKVRMPIVFDLDPDKQVDVIKALQSINGDFENGAVRLKQLTKLDGVTYRRASNRRYDAPEYTKTHLRTGNCYYGNTHSALQIAGELIRDDQVAELGKQNNRPWQFRARGKAKKAFLSEANNMLGATLKGDVQRKKVLTQYIDVKMNQAARAGRTYNPFVDQKILGNPSEDGLFDKQSQQKRQNLIYQLSVNKPDWQLQSPVFPVRAPRDWRPMVTTKIT